MSRSRQPTPVSVKVTSTRVASSGVRPGYQSRTSRCGASYTTTVAQSCAHPGVVGLVDEAADQRLDGDRARPGRRRRCAGSTGHHSPIRSVNSANATSGGQAQRALLDDGGEGVGHRSSFGVDASTYASKLSSAVSHIRSR